MAIRLTESRLRQIIREEASRLLEGPGRTHGMYVDNATQRLADEVQQALDLAQAAPRDLVTLRSYVAQGDEEAIIFMLKRAFKRASGDPMVDGVMARLEEMAEEDPSELYETLGLVDSLRMDTELAHSQSDAVYGDPSVRRGKRR